MTGPTAQPDLFGNRPGRYPHGPGHRGVRTSVIAAESMMPHVSATQGRILIELRKVGAGGMTYTEIMSATALGAPTVCGRMCELVEAKLVKISDKTRPTPSRRPARVYVAAEFAR